MRQRTNNRHCIEVAGMFAFTSCRPVTPYSDCDQGIADDENIVVKRISDLVRALID